MSASTPYTFQQNFRFDKEETKMWKCVYQLHFKTKFRHCFFLVVDSVFFSGQQFVDIIRR